MTTANADQIHSAPAKPTPRGPAPAPRWHNPMPPEEQRKRLRASLAGRAMGSLIVAGYSDADIVAANAVRFADKLMAKLEGKP